jgi:hypothetical protein
MPREPKPLKVWNGWGIHSMPHLYRNQVLTIIAAESGAAVRRYAEAQGLKISASMWRDHWNESGNDLSIAVAQASPRLVLYQPMNLSVPSGLRGVWLPWAWDWPATSVFEARQLGPTPCTVCGTGIDECDEMVFAKHRACCSACSYSGTHNDPLNPAHHERIARAAARVKARADA